MRNTPRSGLASYKCPMAATKTTLAFLGSMAILPMCCVSSSPMCVHVLPASVDLYMPLPYPIESRSVDSPVPTYIVFGLGRRHGQRANRRDRLRVEDREPDASGIDRLPHAAVDRAEIELVGPAGTPLTASTRPPRNGPSMRHLSPEYRLGFIPLWASTSRSRTPCNRHVTIAVIIVSRRTFTSLLRLSLEPCLEP